MVHAGADPLLKGEGFAAAQRRKEAHLETRILVAQSRRNLKLKGDEKSHLERSD
jgi:hypothetical protein